MAVIRPFQAVRPAQEVASKVASLPPKTIDWRANINNRLVPVVETWKKAAGKA